MSIFDPISVTGGTEKKAPNNVDPKTRSISIKDPTNSVSNPNAWNGQKVWLLMPGFFSAVTQLDNLANTIHTSNPQDIVLTLDWTQVSFTSALNNKVGVTFGDLYISGSWFTPVAQSLIQKMTADWGMPAAALNLVGFSLGAHLASEVAAQYQGVGKVGSVTAIDPASNSNFKQSEFDRVNGFDTDLSNGYLRNSDPTKRQPDPIKPLNANATISRSFNGIDSTALLPTSSLAGNEPQSGTAAESLLFDFVGKDTISQHEAVLDAFTNLVTVDANGNSRLATDVFSAKDTAASHGFRPDAYKGPSTGLPGIPPSVQQHEAVIPVDAQNMPIFLVAKQANGGANDKIIYGNNGDDTLTGVEPFSQYYNDNGNNIYGNNGDDTLTGVEPFSQYYNDNGNNIYYVGAGNDIVRGGDGNDTIYGGDGNDSLTGDDTLTGSGSDTIYGGDGNDTLTGGSGSDVMDGGQGNDRILGDAGNDTLFGGLGNDRIFGGSGFNRIQGFTTDGGGFPLNGVNEVDILVHSAGSQNIFVLQANGKNAYTQNGNNDYATIFGYIPFQANGQGGDVIEVGTLLGTILPSAYAVSSGSDTLIKDKITDDLMAIVVGVSDPFSILFV